VFVIESTFVTFVVFVVFLLVLARVR